MPGLTDALALAVALGFMLGAFGQIPINDYMIGKMASGPARARIYGVRYVVSYTVLAITLPLIGIVHANWGFDALFLILATVILPSHASGPLAVPSPQTGGPAASRGQQIKRARTTVTLSWPPFRLASSISAWHPPCRSFPCANTISSIFSSVISPC